MYTADAIDEELVPGTPVDPAEQEALRGVLETVSELLDNLAYLVARRRSYINSRAAGTNNTDASASSVPHSQPA